MDISYRQLEYQNNSSLKKKYFYKLLSNIFNSIVSILIQLIAPRALGPKSYGDFNFLTSFFSNLTDFFDMGTSTTVLKEWKKELQMSPFERIK